MNQAVDSFLEMGFVCSSAASIVVGERKMDDRIVGDIPPDNTACIQFKCTREEHLRNYQSIG